MTALPTPERPTPPAVAEVEPILQELAPEKRQVIRSVIAMAEEYSGPLPHPRMMAEYAKLVPNAPERLFALLEKEAVHRQGIETTVVNGHVARTKRAQWMAFILALVFGAAGVWLADRGHYWVAGTVFATTIGGLALVFLTGRGQSTGILGADNGAGDQEDEEEPSPPPAPPRKLPKKPRR